jgi:hypothetical protein
MPVKSGARIQSTSRRPATFHCGIAESRKSIIGIAMTVNSKDAPASFDWCPVAVCADRFAAPVERLASDFAQNLDISVGQKYDGFLGRLTVGIADWLTHSSSSDHRRCHACCLQDLSGPTLSF